MGLQLGVEVGGCWLGVGEGEGCACLALSHFQQHGGWLGRVLAVQVRQLQRERCQLAMEQQSQ